MNSIIKKLQNSKKDSLVVFFLFVMFGFFLIAQHRLVGMYYDDFGNASLSYGYDSTNIMGTDYTLQDLLAWAKNLYLTWGGRVLYALILVPMLKSGPVLFMFVQACVLLAIFVAMYFVVKKFSQNGNGVVISIILILLYGLLQGNILTQGIYWASASILYIWPILPFLIIILLYMDIERNICDGKKVRLSSYVGLILLIPLVTLSQEQIGGALVVWLICNALMGHYKKDRRYLKLDCFSISYSVVTFGIFFAAPGNWVRLASNENYAELTFMEKILDSTPKVFALLIDNDLKYFNMALIATGVIIIISSVHRKICIILGSLGIVPFLITNIRDIFGVGIHVDIIRGISFGLFLVDMFFLLLNYFILKKKTQFMAVMIAGVASVFCLVVSPAFATRSCLLYVFFCMVLCAIVFGDFWNTISCDAIRLISVIVCVFTFVLSVVNLTRIYRGYEENYYGDRLNFKILKDYNGTDNRIYLLNYANEAYRSSMPCDRGYEFVSHWMKEYFNIPENVDIVYKTADELFQYAKENVIDVIHGEGFYQSEGNFCWATNKAQLKLCNYENEKQMVVLSLQINTGYQQSSNVQIWYRGCQIYDESVNIDGTICSVEIELMPGENIVDIITDAQQIDSGADIRCLYMRIENLRCEKK